MRSELPPPDADALAHSVRLAALLREEIRAHGGFLPFSNPARICANASANAWRSG